MRLPLFIFFLVASKLLAQEKPDLQKLMPKKFIDKWELLAGINWNLPNDHGFSDYYKSLSQNTMTYEFKSKKGYLLGIGAIHPFGKRFDITGRLFYERRNYNQENTASYPNRFVSSKDEISNDYIILSLIPRVYRKKQLYIGIGVSYGRQVKYTDKFTQYINGQLSSQSTITNTSDLKTNILDIVSCLGYMISVNNSNWVAVQVTFSYGLNDLYNANQLRLSSNCVNISLNFIHQRKKILPP